MRSIKIGLKYFGLAYLIGTVVGFITFYINPIIMWIALFTIMPVVFGCFFFMYLKNKQTGSKESFQETNKLILLWIVLSFLLDGIVYIVFIPLFLGAQPNWTFFLDQSPWIWLNYLTIIILGHVSRLIYMKRLMSR